MFFNSRTLFAFEADQSAEDRTHEGSKPHAQKRGEHVRSFAIEWKENNADELDGESKDQTRDETSDRAAHGVAKHVKERER